MDLGFTLDFRLRVVAALCFAESFGDHLFVRLPFLGFGIPDNSFSRVNIKTSDVAVNGLAGAVFYAGKISDVKCLFDFHRVLSFLFRGTSIQNLQKLFLTPRVLFVLLFPRDN